jgi:hypothetical protein
MRRFTKKQYLVAGVAAAIIAGTAGSAIAFWSTSGTGTGSASTSAGSNDLTITQTSVISNMYPGDSAQTISGTVTNTNATQSEYVNDVTVSIASVTQTTAGLAAGTCDATDYALGSPAMHVTTDLAHGATAPFTGATLQFFNKTASNQDGCKGATVNLAYASN